MKRILTALTALLLPSMALAQGALLQGGPITPGHAPMYIGAGGQTVVQDSGPAGGGAVGLGMSEGLFVARGTGAPPYAGQGTGPYGTNICDYDAPITNPSGYHYLCASANAQGGGLIAFGAAGSAARLPLNFVINGSFYGFPGNGMGNVLGPNTTTIGDVAVWNNNSGSLLSDSGFPPAPLANAIYALSFGCKTDNSTDDTSCWNRIVSYINDNPGTTVMASVGTSLITSLNKITASNSFIACSGGPGDCVISHSGNNALTWSSTLSGGGLIRMGLNNSGAACNSTILVNNGAQQLTFDNLSLGSGIGTLVTLGSSGSGNAAGLTTWRGMTSPSGVANANCGLFNLVNGAGLIRQNNVVFVSGKGVSGRNLTTANITGPAGAGFGSWDTVQDTGNTWQFFYSETGGVLSSGGLFLDNLKIGNFINNCIGPCFNISVPSGTSLSSFVAIGNWLDNDIGKSDCVDILGSGGNIFGVKIALNQINGCGSSGIVVGGNTPNYSTTINGNQIVNVNVLDAGTTYCILVEGDGVDGVFLGAQITGNRCNDSAGSFIPMNMPTYGIAVSVASSGGAGVQNSQVTNNSAAGSTANYLWPVTYTNFIQSDNLGFSAVPQVTTSCSVTYSTPATSTWLKIKLIGGGGGGAGSGTSPGAATAGTATTFGTLSAGYGNLGNTGAGGTGGTNSGTANISIAGGHGGQVTINNESIGGDGAASAVGGSGAGGSAAAAGSNAAANSGSGGGGAGSYLTANTGGGGGAGGYIETIITAPAASYSCSTGAGGTGGTAGTGGYAGGNGGSGLFYVEAHFAGG